MTPLRYIIRTALMCVAIINYGEKNSADAAVGDKYGQRPKVA